MLLLFLGSCAEKGSEEPHAATLYDICDVASDNGAAVFNLYRPDSDIPVVLTAPGRVIGKFPLAWPKRPRILPDGTGIP